MDDNLQDVDISSSQTAKKIDRKLVGVSEAMRNLSLYTDLVSSCMEPHWVWDILHKPWEANGETFLTVSPGLIIAWVSNAEAIHQITSRRETFPKPLKSYKILDIFGRNIITTEGTEWKQHRKITSRNFNESNNALVFSEACTQTQGMLRQWISPNRNGNSTIKEVAEDTMRLTLHIISSIGFGMRLLWPGEEVKEDQREKESYSSNEPPPGHSMSFESALSTLLDRLILVLLTPKWLLQRLPFKGSQEASESFANWTQYMDELFSRKKIEARGYQRREGMDIMGSLVASAYGENPNPCKETPSSSVSVLEKGEIGKPILSDSEILGNAFVMIVAGHETTGNSIHFSLIELATNPKSQREVQKEIQAIFGAEPPENWDYESNINKLLGGIVGAVLNEQLRLMPPVIAIPKSVPKNQNPVITIDGKKIMLPAGTHVGLCTIAAHRNARYWPTKPSTVSTRPDDLDDFKPERWLVRVDADGKQQADNSPSQSGEDDDYEGFTGNSSHSKLFRPVPGSYLPFSEGARSCLGRRLAQVEIMAVLAVIFQQYSVELAVDEWASDGEVSKMSVAERNAVYQKAQAKARLTMRGAISVITLKLNGACIPLRLVKRGGERFIGDSTL
jgi:cytochrome P450